MKKLFFFMLTLVAAVFAMSSCSSDDDNNSGKNDNLVPFKYYLALSNDVFDFYDVNITRTAAGKTVTYSFNKSYTLQWKDYFTGKVLAEYPGKIMDKDSLSLNKGESGTVKATFTVKDNWQSVLDARTEGKVNFKYSLDKIKPLSDGKVSASTTFGGSSFAKKEAITKDILDKCATNLARDLTME